MRCSVSNLAFQGESIELVAPILLDAGMRGVEIAPTLIWPEAPHCRLDEVREYARKWSDFNIQVSGVQSLFFGKPELRVLDRQTWPAARVHLIAMLHLAEALSTHVAVFGSPRNRVRGNLPQQDADKLFAEFLGGILPHLDALGIVLTLEPNAPEYGADYLTTYSDAVAACDVANSAWVKPQIDSGCLVMVGEDPSQAIGTHLPWHVHISAPHLAPLPGIIDGTAIHATLAKERYGGWVVLEALTSGHDPLGSLRRQVDWLITTFGGDSQ